MGVSLQRGRIIASITFKRGETIFLGGVCEYEKGAPEMNDKVKEAGRLAEAARELRDSKQWERKEDFVKQLAIDKIRDNHNRNLEMGESVASFWVAQQFDEK